MKKLKHIIASGLCLLFMVNAQARKVKGIVTETQNGKILSNVTVNVKNTLIIASTDKKGEYVIEVPKNQSILIFTLSRYVTKEVVVGSDSVLNVSLNPLVSPKILAIEDEMAKDMNAEEIHIQHTPEVKELSVPANSIRGARSGASQTFIDGIAVRSFPISGSRRSKHKKRHVGYGYEPMPIVQNSEEYDVINENVFKSPFNDPLSTFSIDVDAASYSNVRRMLNNGQNPNKDMVRIEEMINYFNYDYPAPSGEHPFSITTEVSKAPWNEKHQLVHVGLQGKNLDYNDVQPSNLVFLIDVSGSMSSHNKLPLLKSSMKLLVNQLDDRDRVAIVVYAGAAGLVLPSTPASEKQTILNALNRLNAGGSTAGGAGIKLAYQVAKKHLLKNGNNRVILATDGDFNVGASSNQAMVKLIEEKRKDGIFLTITGFGMGNYKDAKMEQISNAGNGNYFYIDNIKEAEKVFVKEMRATLFTIAKDVKIQVEFNPKNVQAYRLIGYENRMLKAEDFNDDTKDAGELGAGHTVTALYEIIPVGVESSFSGSVDKLKYQLNEKVQLSDSDEILTVKFRYKKPKEDQSRLIVQTLKNKEMDISETSDNFRFSAAVAQFGMLLRDSKFKKDASYTDVLSLAKSAKGKDKNGYRAEFIGLVTSSKLLANR